METSDIRDELLGEIRGFRPPKIKPKYIAVCVAITAFGLYLFYVLYGSNNSLYRLLELQQEERLVAEKVEALKNENAKIRRDLYEIKLIFGER